MAFHSDERRSYPRLPSPRGTVVAWQSTNKTMVSGVENFGLGGIVYPHPKSTRRWHFYSFVARRADRRGAGSCRGPKEPTQRRYGREVRRYATRRSSAIRRMAQKATFLRSPSYPVSSFMLIYKISDLQHMPSSFRRCFKPREMVLGAGYLRAANWC